MSKRLNVQLDDVEIRAIEAAARAQSMTVSTWVRRALRRSLAAESSPAIAEKLDAVRAASRLSFPAPDIEQMLAEIESGYEE